MKIRFVDTLLLALATLVAPASFPSSEPSHISLSPPYRQTCRIEMPSGKASLRILVAPHAERLELRQDSSLWRATIWDVGDIALSVEKDNNPERFVYEIAVATLTSTDLKETLTFWSHEAPESTLANWLKIHFSQEPAKAKEDLFHGYFLLMPVVPKGAQGKRQRGAGTLFVSPQIQLSDLGGGPFALSKPGETVTALPATFSLPVNGSTFEKIKASWWQEPFAPRELTWQSTGNSPHTLRLLCSAPEKSSSVTVANPPSKVSDKKHENALLANLRAALAEAFLESHPPASESRLDLEEALVGPYQILCTQFLKKMAKRPVAEVSRPQLNEWLTTYLTDASTGVSLWEDSNLTPLLKRSHISKEQEAVEIHSRAAWRACVAPAFPQFAEPHVSQKK